MKPFNLEKALAGDPVVTKYGRKALDIVVWKKIYKGSPVIAVIDYGDRKIQEIFTLDGKNAYDHKSGLDLFMAPVKREGWVNIHPNKYSTGVYATEAEAREKADWDVIDTVKIEWEE